MPKYENSGSKSRLSNEQLLKLKEELTNPQKSYSLKDAKKFIKEEFDVEFSLKQVWAVTEKNYV